MLWIFHDRVHSPRVHTSPQKFLVERNEKFCMTVKCLQAIENWHMTKDVACNCYRVLKSRERSVIFEDKKFSSLR